MNRLKGILLLFIFWYVQMVSAVQPIIPYPDSVRWEKGMVSLPKKWRVDCEQLFKKQFKQLVPLLFDGQAFSFKQGISADFSIIMDKAIPAEGYCLDAHGERVVISASSDTGVFYAFQTLKQLLKKDVHGYSLPCVFIKDKPAYSWRGFMLDEARNFQGKEEVKKLMDEMAALKLNVFHWHLTDDQGWRVEIKKYPLLAEIGGRRDSTQMNWYESTVYDGKPVAGYYTQQDIREILAYAAERHIQVIPEIEFPGHASAAIAAYPWLGCTAEKIAVPCSYGVFTSVFNVANQQVRQFIYDVLDEVAALFPSEIIHIGGDEVKYVEWEASEEVRRFMKEQKIDSPAGLQVWFTNALASYLKGKGKKMMGWNDITGDKLHNYQTGNGTTGQLDPRNTLVQFWTGSQELLKKALQKGFRIVNSQSKFAYLNYNYDKIVPGLEYEHTPIPMEKAYHFAPVPEGLADKGGQILGLTCAMWGEWTSTPQIMYKMVYPQIAAYAEAAWTKTESKDFVRFQKGLNYFLKRWTQKKYMCKPSFENSSYSFTSPFPENNEEEFKYSGIFL